MQVRNVTQPSALISTADAKTYLRVDHSSDDTLIDQAIKGAVSYGEKYTNMAFLARTVEIVIECMHDQLIRLPILPVNQTSGVTSVKYYYENAIQTLNAADYVVDKSRGTIKIKTWPTNIDDDSVWQITYVAGVDTAAELDQNIIKAIYLMVADFYDNRHDGVRERTSASDKLLNPIRNLQAC